MLQWPGNLLHKAIPNLLFTSMLLASFVYYDLRTSGESPTWQNVAVGSMALIGTLAGLGYREYIKKMQVIEQKIEKAGEELQKERERLEREFKEDRKRRDQQHRANMAAIVGLSMSIMDKMPQEQKEKVQQIVSTLMNEDADKA